MARISRVGLGWDVGDRIDWYADLQTWLAVEALIDYGSQIEAVCKGGIGVADTTTTDTPPHGWYAYADPSVYWQPDGTNWETAPIGDRIYVSTPNGRIAGMRFITVNGFGNGFRFNSTATNCIIEDCLIANDHPAGAGSGGEAFRSSSTTNVAERPIMRRCFVRQPAGTQPSVRQATASGHLLIEACVIQNTNNRYVIGSSTGTCEVYDSFGLGASTGDGFASVSTQLFTTASEDTSGSAGLTGINQSALVDYANNDVRTAGSGPLDVAGTNQAFIGISLGAAATDSITLDEFAAHYKVFQRPKTGTELAITVSGSTTGDPSGGVQWRLVDNATSLPIAGYDWQTLLASPAAGAFSTSVNVPVNTSLIKYNIEVRFTTNNTVTDTLTNPFSVGIDYLQYGQSNGLRRVIRTSSTLVPNEFAAYFDGNDWAAFTDGDGAITTVNELIAQYGIPVGYQNYSVDSQSIADLTSGTHWNNLVSGLTTATGSDVEIVGLDQGERDGQLGIPEATYQATNQTLLNNLMSLTGRDSSQITMIVNYGGNSNGYAGGYSTENIEAVRRGKAAFVAANPNVIWGGHRLDLPLADTIHNTADGYAEASHREIQSYLYFKGLVAKPKLGLQIAAVSVTGNVVTVTYNGVGDDLTKVGAGASTITQISEDNFTTLLTISDSVVGTNTVTHTLSTTPTGTVKVRDWYGTDIPTSTYQTLVFPSEGESASVGVSNITVSSTLPSITSSVAFTYEVAPSNVTIASTLPSLTSAVSVSFESTQHNITVSGVLPSLTSNVELSFTPLGSNINISSALPSLSSSVSIENLVPEVNINIASTLPSLTSNVMTTEGILVAAIYYKNIVSITPK